MTGGLAASPRRILVLRPRGLGDIVLASAVLDALKRSAPRAAIDFVAEAPARALLETDERLDRIFLLARRGARAVREGAAGAGGGESGGAGRVEWGGVRAAAAWMRRARPDVVLDLFSNPKTAILTALSGAPVRAGLDKRLRRLVYNVRVPRFRGRPEDDHRWARDVMLDFVRAAGFAWEGEARLSVAWTRHDREFALREAAAHGYAKGSRWGAVLPGGSWESKRWSAEGFAAIARTMAERCGHPTLIVWGPPEEEDARRIAALAGEGARLAPPSSIREMAALLAEAALLVSTDCLGRHLAIAAGVPTLGIFGTTDPRDWTPRTGLHPTIGGPDGRYANDLRALPAGDVAVAVHDLLERVFRPSAGVLDSPGP